MAKGPRASKAAVASQTKQRSMSIDQLVNKKLYDNFKGFGPSETDCKLVAGKTLRQKIKEDLEACAAHKGPAMGGIYWRRLREE